MASLSAALALKDPAASLAAVKELALNDPTDAPTAVACADLHLRIGMARAAAKYCAAALSADATMVRAHMVHARTLAALGKPNKACTSARTALSLARDAADGARIGAAPARKHASAPARQRFINTGMFTLGGFMVASKDMRLFFYHFKAKNVIFKGVFAVRDKNKCDFSKYGIGVEKVFEELKRLFPTKKIKIFSSDFLSRKR